MKYRMDSKTDIKPYFLISVSYRKETYVAVLLVHLFHHKDEEQVIDKF